MKRIGLILLLLLAGLSARAQFFSSGSDPGGVRWSTISSDHFRIVYPVGNDSLALQYGLTLEKYRVLLGGSLGYAPNSQYRRPMPVVLHSYTAAANGSVAWAPRRMDLFTRPESLRPEATEWITELAVHESRHVAQMQFARDRGYGVFNALIGELFTGGMSAIYPGPALLEGDAVVAETALTGAGRGRTADFLEYYRVSFADGDFRNWYRWRWGSLKYYTPDHYRAGYMLIAGTRYVYDDPLFMKRYYDNIVSPWWPFPHFVLKKTLRQASGQKIKGTWQEIAAAQQALWAADEAARGPFGPVRQLTPPRRRFTEFLSPEALGDDIYAVRQGITRPAELVRVLPDGQAAAVRPFSAGTSLLRYSESLDRLFWSEEIPDPRWTLKSDSRIFYLEPGSRKAHRLTREGNLSNPSPSPDGSAVAVTEYPVRGGSAVRVIDGGDGRTLRRYPAPDSLQVVETAWLSGRLVASAISPAGFGFYDVTDGYRSLTAPVYTKIKQLRSDADGVLFVSDLNGVNELYRLSADGSLTRLTNHRFGASDFLPLGDSLLFAALTPDGRHLYTEPAPSPAVSSSSFPASTGNPWPIADCLSAQENALSSPAAALSSSTHSLSSSAPSLSFPATTGNPFSAPRPYRKLPHLLRLHSWAPMYIDYDEISSSSFETISSAAGIGATAFFQNDLGTADIILGYSAATYTEEEEMKWDHSFHARFTYNGLYPVIELGTDIGAGHARQYSVLSLLQENSRALSISGEDTDLPSYRISAKVYIPWDFSSAGWFRGVVPRIDATFSNDMVYTAELFQRLVRMIGDKPGIYRTAAGAGPGRQVPLTRLSANLRGYAVQSRARSALYPRWGIGAEGGLSMRPGATDLFAPTAYAFLYGYLPGLMDTHGIRLSASYQASLDGKLPDTVTNVLPRGMSQVKGLSSYLMSVSGSQARITFDYGLPLLPLDWSGLGPLAYVRNLELTLHADGTFLGRPKTGQTGIIPRIESGPAWLFSAGADLAVRLSNFLWIPYDTRVGVSWNANGGSLLGIPAVRDLDIPAHRFGFIFTVDIP